MSIVEFIMNHYIMIAELLGLWGMLDIGVHLNKRTVSVTRTVIFLIFIESIVWYIEFCLRDYSTLSLWRPILTATIYLLQPLILMAIMEIYAPIKKHKFLLYLPLVISAVILYTSQWTHLVFYYTADNKYLGHDPYYHMFPYFLFIFYAIVFLIRFIICNQKYSVRIRVVIYFISAACLAGVVIHVIYHSSVDYGTLFASFLILYYLFLYMQTSKIDTLTGLMNRQCYYFDIEKEKRKISSVVSVDMNDLKRINDSEGHEAGDIALCTVADCLLVGTGRTKSVYRIGGDEFAILYFDKTEQEVQADIEVMKGELAKTEYVCAFGYEMIDEHEDIDTAMKEADEIMYAHKRKIKNTEERQIAEHKEAMINVMHEALHSGMWGMEFDENGTMISVSWSKEFREMIGFIDESDFPNTLEAWSSRLHPDDYNRVLREFNETVEDYSNTKTYDVEYQFQIKNGEWRWFHAMGRLLRRKDGSPLSYVGMFVDITSRKEAQEELQQALIQAEQASFAKTTFLSNMSHDIRTPINGIMGMTVIALEHLDERDRVEECLRAVDDSAHHLLSLVNDVLDLSRIEAGKITKNSETFDMNALIGNCISIISGQLNGKNIDISVDTENLEHTIFIGDELHLRQVFINILGNSVKFTNPGDSISVKAEEVSFKDGIADVKIYLSDTGIGMSKDYLPRLYEAFSQEVSDARTKYHGTGLGMAITKQFMDLMGGTISVESELGVGTTFTLELSFEVDVEEHLVDHMTSHKDYDVSGMKVLVAEDVDVNLIIVETLLEENGVIVTTTEDGDEVVEAFKDSEVGYYDAILMDIMMPKMDGLEATRVIRGLDREDAKTIPIIATTANAFEEDGQRAMDAGMNAHVTKPIDVVELFSTLDNFYHGGNHD
ncbi:MAG: response regulator [Lachnospiraceae bacterium]|nr:response regulator [Lachnospiraceae bacterium]